MAIENSEERTDAKSGGLCVPQDSLDDLDFFPNFPDDFISVIELLPTPEDDETIVSENFSPAAEEAQKRERKMWEECDKMASTTAKRRRRYNSDDNYDGWKKRKCSHCETEETPQWRTGPMGPKTLCNACGVRYKSGRLVPEYRPVASPSFDRSKHSNFHRKIMQDKRV